MTGAAADESPRRNVELKARDADPKRSLRVAAGLDGVVEHGVLWQRDTYFHVPHGRLKLREQQPGDEAWLIPYERPDETAARVSRYRLIGVDDPAACRAGLDAALGTRVVVEKRRRLFVWQDVRIHLDEVVDLGSFIELEAVAPATSALAAERRRIAELTAAFAIAGEDLVATGYADALVGIQAWHDPATGAPR